MAPLAPWQIPALLDWVRAHPLRKGMMVPVCIWGEKGTGKTAVVGDYARQRGYGMRVYQPAHDHTGGEALGVAYRDPETDRTHYAPPAFLPTPTEVAVFNAEGILLIDEVNRATPQVLAGLFELIGEGAISQSGFQMPAGWQIVLTANPEGGEYGVTPLDPALKDRMLHVEMGWHPREWSEWARGAGLEEDVARFADEDIALEHAIAPERALIPSVSPTPRSLEYLATLYEPGMDPSLAQTIASGLLGTEIGGRFLATSRGAVRPLTGDQVMSGVWRRYLRRFDAEGEEMALTLRSLVDWLARHEPGVDQARGLVAFLDALPARAGDIVRHHLRTRERGWGSLVAQVMAEDDRAPFGAG